MRGLKSILLCTVLLALIMGSYWSNTDHDERSTNEAIKTTSAGPTRDSAYTPPRPKRWSPELKVEPEGRGHKILWGDVPIEPFSRFDGDRSPFERLQVSGGRRLDVSEALRIATQHYQRIIGTEPVRIRTGREIVWIFRLSNEGAAWGRVAQEFFINEKRLIVDRENGEILSSRTYVNHVQ